MNKVLLEDLGAAALVTVSVAGVVVATVWAVNFTDPQVRYVRCLDAGHPVEACQPLLEDR